MNFEKTILEGLLIISPKVFADERGWFTETYSKEQCRKMGIEADFVQDNHAMSVQKDTLRGIHFQINPKAQAKIVRCSKGAVLDVAVDLRKDSPTFKKWLAIELSEENKKQLFIPKGFGHAYLTLTDNTEFQYKVDEYYAPEFERSILFNDPEIGIDWGIENPILSEKDKNAPLLKDTEINFVNKENK